MMKTTMLELVSILGVLLLVLMTWALGPLLILWALNVLFPWLVIPYTWKTWAAMLICMGLLRGVANVKITRK